MPLLLVTSFFTPATGPDTNQADPMPLTLTNHNRNTPQRLEDFELLACHWVEIPFTFCTPSFWRAISVQILRKTVYVGLWFLSALDGLLERFARLLGVRQTQVGGDQPQRATTL